jgi:type II secretory pathway pseudopilin PulG
MKTKRQKKKNGFSLIEIVVSLGIFMAVVTIAMGAVLTLFDSNKRVQDLKSIINNLNVSLDSMTRELVVGSNYVCGGITGSLPGPMDQITECPDDAGAGAGTTIVFCSSDNQPIAYRYLGQGIDRRIGDLENTDTECQAGTSIEWLEEWIRITAPEVKINDMKFYVSAPESPQSGVGDSCFKQSRVLIKIDGEAGRENRKTEFELQTTISQRMPDLPVLNEACS